MRSSYQVGIVNCYLVATLIVGRGNTSYRNLGKSTTYEHIRYIRIYVYLLSIMTYRKYLTERNCRYVLYCSTVFQPQQNNSRIKRGFRWGEPWINTVVGQSKLFVDGPDLVGERRRSRCVVLTVEVPRTLILTFIQLCFLHKYSQTLSTTENKHTYRQYSVW